MPQKFHLRGLCTLSVWRQSGAELYDSVTQGEGKLPAFRNTLSEVETQLLVAHIRESARSRRSEKWPWQPVIRG